jgi:N-hydroxyarylamine O-acetyltransferase
VSARVFNGSEHGPEFDHAAILVTIDSEEHLADVGFGAFSAEPLRLVLDQEQHDEAGTFVIRKREDGYLEVMKREDGVWRSEYIFRDTARELAEFSEMCEFQQYSPESHFTKGKLCSIMTVSGRKTLTDKSFIVTSSDGKSEAPVGSENEFYEILEREFSITR